MKRTIGILGRVACFLLWTSTAGCLNASGSPERVLFSPDGAVVAYLWEDRLEELAVEGRVLRRSIKAYWCRADQPNDSAFIEVNTVGLKYAEHASIPLDMKFSPDSRRLGVLSPGLLAVIDLDSRSLRRIARGEISSFQWLSDAQIAYVVHSKTKEGKGWARTFWRAQVGDRRGRTSLIFRQKTGERHAGVLSPSEYWAPSGRYAVFMDSPHGGRYQLLDLVSATVRAFGQSNAAAHGVSWARDSTMAFCLSTGREDKPEAVLLHAATGKLVDCTQDYVKTFGGGRWPPTLEPLWTIDGKYVLANDHLGIGGCLLRPSPWKVIRIGGKFRKHLALRGDYAQLVFSLPVPGYVGVLGTGEDGKYAVDQAPKYGVSYDGKTVKLLFDTFGWWAFSPNGTVAATVNQRSREVKLHALGKWWLDATEPARARAPGSSPARTAK